ncbi:MAG TPA: HAMP domain-containing sensor histidine kinase [Anaerolineales bacterium]
MLASIRSRLWISYAALIAAALLIVAVVQVVFLLRNPTTYRQTSLRVLAAQNLLQRGPAAVEKADIIAEALDVRVMVFSASGALTSDSAANRPELRLPSEPRIARLIDTTMDASGRPWLFSSTRLTDGRLVLVAAPRPRLLPPANLLRDELWRPMIQGGLAALVLALIFAYLLAGWIAAPIQRLAEAARSVASGGSRKSARASPGKTVLSLAGMPEAVPEEGPQEVRELTRSFNSMVQRVEASQRSQREFLANVSHELKTPLTSIQGFSQAILDGTADTPAAQRQAAEVIHAEAERMHRMAVDLMELARLDAGTADLHMGPVDVRGLLSGVGDRLRPIAQAQGVDLVFTLPPTLATLRGDADRLSQIFNNLIDNAVKFTPRGGRVDVRAEPEGGGVRIAVSDTGPGISARDLPHIFERFFQADEARGGGGGHGAGLGLAIAREMAEAHGGRITVRSELGHGAEFVVHLPPLEGSRVERGAA